jgi:hypothetical protein
VKRRATKPGMRGRIRAPIAHDDDCPCPLDDSHTDCPFPAGPDTDRAEMLLAESIAGMHGWVMHPGGSGAIADAVAGEVAGDDYGLGSVWRAAYNGAHEQWHRDSRPAQQWRVALCSVCRDGDGGDADAFAAGAALCIAMETGPDATEPAIALRAA